MSNKILVVAAHPDDEVLGCGRTIIKHIKNGDIVEIILMLWEIALEFKSVDLAPQCTMQQLVTRTTF